MLKRINFLMMFLVAVTLSIHADTWKLHDYYVGSKTQNVFDTKDKVYYLNCNHLFVFDKTTLETTSLNKQNVLSDNLISQIYYDCDAQLLFVTYTNSNIDVIDANGNVTNISGIKDVVVHVQNYTLTTGVLTGCSGKEINDITFADGCAYVATGFGYAVIDESTLRIKESYQLGLNVNSVARLGDNLVILTNIKCLYGPVGSTSPLTEYTATSGTYSGTKMFPINDTSVFVMASSLYRYDFTSGTPTITTLVESVQMTSIQRSPDGFYGNITNSAYYYIIDGNGQTATKAGSGICFVSSYPSGDGAVWFLTGEGLRKDGVNVYYGPNSIGINEPYWLKHSAALGVLYVANSGANGRTTEATSGGSRIYVYDGEKWKTANAYSADCAGYEFMFNPVSPTTYVRAGWSNGINKVTNNKRDINYTSSNSPITKYKPAPAFDNYGNLWVVSSYGKSASPVVVLTKDKVANTSVSTSDWFIPSGLLDLNSGSMKRSRFVISKKNNVKIYTNGDINSVSYKGQIVCWDNGEEDPTVDNYKMVSIKSFVDQNNKTIDWTYITHMEEDNDGLIWVGHTSGLFAFDPDGVFDEKPQAIRPYVSNFSEGKGMLVDGISVYDIGVDRNNNKWIATADNGLYYVSPDGTEVYNHFTTSNSDLPSDVVYSVECDTVNDRVYVYTQGGFAEYVAVGDAAALNFDDVYAFPNPVEPDYTGLIKIRGLMENSYVTITDRDGNVLEQMGPVMGSALWDGCDDNGERLPTGIYYIYAAQGAQPATTGTPQASVMIIK